MVEIVNLPTRAATVDADVAERFERLREYVESGHVSGMVVGLTFRDGSSVSLSTTTENRRAMLGLLLDVLMDFQRNST